MKVLKYMSVLFMFLLLMPTIAVADTLTATLPDTLSAISPVVTETTVAVQEEVVAEAEPVLNSGNTAWIIVATILVMMMTIPGLALFYGGLVRRKNVLSIFMQCLVLTAVISIEWIIIGYTSVFGTSFMPDENGAGGSLSLIHI